MVLIRSISNIRFISVIHICRRFKYITQRLRNILHQSSRTMKRVPDILRFCRYQNFLLHSLLYCIQRQGVCGNWMPRKYNKYACKISQVDSIRSVRRIRHGQDSTCSIFNDLQIAKVPRVVQFAKTTLNNLPQSTRAASNHALCNPRYGTTHYEAPACPACPSSSESANCRRPTGSTSIVSPPVPETQVAPSSGFCAAAASTITASPPVAAPGPRSPSAASPSAAS